MAAPKKVSIPQMPKQKLNEWLRQFARAQAETKRLVERMSAKRAEAK